LFGKLLLEIKEVLMKLGLESYTTRNSGLAPLGVLKLAIDLGLGGVLFELSPFNSFRDKELDKIRGFAEDNGLYIEFGMGSIFHWHPMAQKGRDLLSDAGYNVNVSDAKIAIYHLEIAKKLGSPIMRCVGGNLTIRDEGYDMTLIAEEAVSILKEVCKSAEDMGIKIAMENHADFTVQELASIRSLIDSPVFGFTVDCANLSFDLDDPIRLARIMAPYALTTHCKNYQIIRTRDGLALKNCSLGEGDIDIVSIARILNEYNPSINLNIEIHSQFAPFRLNILDEKFWERHPAPPGDGLSWYLRKSWNKDMLEVNPPNLPDGEESWKSEHEDLKNSISWLKKFINFS
jgi:sugar phosphate isomerase/epimerase